MKERVKRVMYKVQIKRRDSNGNVVELNPISKDKNISLTGTNAKLPSGSKTVGDIIDNLGTLAFADNISIPLASSEQAGVVVLSSETTNTNDETKAATIKAVGDVNNSAVHKTGDEHITGTKNFSDGIIVGGNLKITTKTDESGNTTVDFAEVNA